MLVFFILSKFEFAISQAIIAFGIRSSTSLSEIFFIKPQIL